MAIHEHNTVSEIHISILLQLTALKKLETEHTVQ